MEFDSLGREPFDQDLAFVGMIKWMGAFRHFRQQRSAGDGPLNMPETFDELILRLGRPMPVRKPLPARSISARSRQCYLNAWRLFRRSKKPLHYCEGILVLAGCPIPVQHGWCVDEDGNVLDPSLANDHAAAHFGVELKDDFVIECWATLLRKNLIGIFPNAYLMRKPLAWYEAGINVVPRSDMENDPTSNRAKSK